MGDMTHERCAELLKSVVERAGAGRSAKEQIKELLHMGFTAVELVEHFCFDRTDVQSVLVTEETGDRTTFKNLYEAVDFDLDGILKHIKGSDWEMEISNYKGKNLKLYKRDSKGGDFFKRLELYFDKPGMVIAYAYKPYKKEHTAKKAISIDEPIRRHGWSMGMLGKFETEWECMEVLAQYAEAMMREKNTDK